MIRLKYLLAIVLAATAGPHRVAAEATVGSPLTFRGLCDASAAAWIDKDRFIVASDEDNVLRVFHRDDANASTKEINLGPFLTEKKKGPETDIEGAARVGNRIYWITSHGRNRSGEYRPARYRFFAIDVAIVGGAVHTSPVKMAYTNLLEDLVAEPKLIKYDLRGAADRSPEEQGGLNIEGLSATPDGKLLIGFRSPLAKGLAIVVPLTNSQHVIEGRNAKFDSPVELNLDNRGIRGFEYWPARKQYVIIAGPANDEEREFQLYLWTGKADDPPKPIDDVDFKGLHPESLVVGEDAREVLVICDDGGYNIDGEECKKLDATEQRFRAVLVTLDPVSSGEN